MRKYRGKKMTTLRIMVTGLLLIAFAMNIISAAQDENISPDELIDDIGEYNGSIGPDNALYGLKLAFERLDEGFTFNETEKLEKKVYHSKLRISEAKTELKKKNDEGAKKAFENYREKIKETEVSISDINGTDSGIINSQKMAKKHQYVLERLLEIHPNNTGLKNAYYNSIELEDKFEEKTQKKLESVQTKEGKHYLREAKKEDKDESGVKEFNNELKLNAKIIDNKTQVEIKLNFISNKTDNLSIADEILKELRLSKDNISNMIEIEDSKVKELKSILESQAKIGLNVSRINVDYRFTLESTNGTEIINGTYNKLSNLTRAQILDILEIQTIQNDKDILQEEKENKSEENNEIPAEKNIRNKDEKPEDHYARQEQNDKRED